MSFKHITELRKAGKIDEAYAEANAYIANNVSDIWAIRAMGWVLYDMIKESCQETDNDKFSVSLKKLMDLNVPLDETMLLNNLVWIFAKRINDKTDNFVKECSAIFQFLKKYTITSSEGYSFLFHAFHKCRNEWMGYLDFCDWWNFDNFTPQDYKKYKAGKQEIMSLVEQAYIGYAKQLLSTNEKKRIELFLPRLDKLMNTHPEYMYPLYFRSKLLLLLGKKQEAFKQLLPFVRKKQNDYWVWQILGDASEIPSITFACYSKALTCHSKDEMLVSIKERYAKMLTNKKLFNEAKTEIEQVVKIRNAHKWILSSFIQQETRQPWYEKATSNKSNKEFYIEHATSAMDVLYKDIEREQILITDINIQKSMANFTTPAQKTGFFCYAKSQKAKLNIGDIFEVRFSEYHTDHASHIDTIEPAKDSGKWSDCIKSFTGKIKINAERRFGIVISGKGNIFVPSQMMGGLSDNSTVEVMAVKSFDKKRKCPGWTAIRLNDKKQ